MKTLIPKTILYIVSIFLFFGLLNFVSSLVGMSADTGDEKYVFYWWLIFRGYFGALAKGYLLVLVSTLFFWLTWFGIKKQENQMTKKILKFGFLTYPFIFLTLMLFSGDQKHINTVELNGHKYHWSVWAPLFACCAHPEPYYKLWECDKFGLGCRSKDVAISEYLGHHNFDKTFPFLRVDISKGVLFIHVPIIAETAKITLDPP